MSAVDFLELISPDLTLIDLPLNLIQIFSVNIYLDSQLENHFLIRVVLHLKCRNVPQNMTIHRDIYPPRFLALSMLFSSPKEKKMKKLPLFITIVINNVDFIFLFIHLFIEKSLNLTHFSTIIPLLSFHFSC